MRCTRERSQTSPRTSTIMAIGGDLSSVSAENLSVRVAVSIFNFLHITMSPNTPSAFSSPALAEPPNLLIGRKDGQQVAALRTVADILSRVVGRHPPDRKVRSADVRCLLDLFADAPTEFAASVGFVYEALLAERLIFCQVFRERLGDKPSVVLRQQGDAAHQPVEW